MNTKKIKLTITLICTLSATVFAQKIDDYLYAKVTYKLERELTKTIPANTKAYKGPEYISMAKKLQYNIKEEYSFS